MEKLNGFGSSPQQQPQFQRSSRMSGSWGKTRAIFSKSTYDFLNDGGKHGQWILTSFTIPSDADIKMKTSRRRHGVCTNKDEDAPLLFDSSSFEYYYVFSIVFLISFNFLFIQYRIRRILRIKFHIAYKRGPHVLL